MNELKVFNFNENQVRTFESNGQVWFCLTDVCKILDLGNTGQVKSRLNQKGITTNDTLTNGGIQLMTYIDEANLYKTIFQSRKEEAERFTDWVTNEVLPDIRKHGLYMTDNLLQKTLDDPDFMIDLLTKYKQEREEKKMLQGKVEMLVHTQKLYTATEIAKELGFKSATELNKNLLEKGVQYKVNNTWVLTSQYADKKYTSIKQEVLENGKVIYDRKWTGVGRKFLLELYKAVS